MIYITHDIDWLTPTHAYSIIKTATHGKKWINVSQLFNRNIFLQGIQSLQNTNAQHQVNGIWHIGASSKHTYKQFGLRYNIQTSNWIKALHILKERNAVIGLHSVNTESIKDQVQCLQQITQQPIQFHRSHYLKYTPQQLYPQLQQCGITTDFSLGQAREITLPTNSNLNQAVKCIPTVLFDNIFFFQSPETIFSAFKLTLQKAHQQQQPIAVLFHPENFLVNPALHEYYQETLRIIKSIA